MDWIFIAGKSGGTVPDHAENRSVRTRIGLFGGTTCPLWHIAVAFSVGILGRAWLPVFPPVSVVVGLGLFWGWVVRRRETSPWSTFLALTVAALTGGWWYGVETHASSDRLGHVLETFPSDAPVRVVGVLREWPEPAPDRCYFNLETDAVQLATGRRPVRGSVRISVSSPIDPRLWPPGTKVELDAWLTRDARFHNPGGTDFDVDRNSLDAVGRAVGTPRGLSVGTATGWRAWTGRLRLAGFDLLDRQFEPKTAGVLKASLLGSRYFLDRRWADRFRDSGTFHLLVISGSHLALLAWLVHLLAGRLTRVRAVGIAATCGLVWFYAVLVGNDPPVLRAAVGVTAWQVSRLVYRRPDPMNTVGLAMIVLLIGNPNNLFLPSFQLTVGAVLVLVTGVAPLWATVRDIGRWHPRRATPLPPRCPAWIRRLGEALFWEPRTFAERQRRSPVTFRLEKSPVAGWLDGLSKLENTRLGKLLPIDLRALLQGTALLVLATTGVQLVLLPLNLAYFNRFSPGGIISNVCAEIAMSFLVVAAIPYFVLAGCFPGWESRLVPVLSKLVAVLVWSADLSPHSLRLPHLVGGWTWLYAVHGAACAGVLVGLRRWNPWTRGTRWRSRLFWWNVVVVLGLSVLVCAVPRRWVSGSDGRLRVTFLDVGQGDAVVVEFPNGQTMLVDGGGVPRFTKSGMPSADFQPDEFRIGEQVVSRYLWSRGIRHLDYLVATHGDADHVQGLADVARNFSVGAALCGYIDDGAAHQEEWLAEVKRRGIPVIPVRTGDRLACGAATVEVVWPAGEVKPSSDNDSSVVLKISLGRRSVVLTGDIEARTETDLVRFPQAVRCDVLKAPHHGSRTSSSVGFLAAAAPSAVVFCAPRVSRFGHPHPEVVARYREIVPGISLWQTGIDGAVTVETDGSKLTLDSWWTKRKND